MPIWTFVRHGQSEANRDGWFAGHVDSPLTPLGKAQARAMRRPLHEVAFQRALCSDLVRAQRTATIMLEGNTAPLHVHRELRERSMGLWERRAISEIAALGDAMASLHDWTARPPEGESLRDVATRAAASLAAVDADADADTLVVCHGALMRALLGALDARPRDQLDQWRPGNCELVSRTCERGRWALLHAELLAEAEPPPRA